MKERSPRVARYLEIYSAYLAAADELDRFRESLSEDELREVQAVTLDDRAVFRHARVSPKRDGDL